MQSQLINLIIPILSLLSSLIVVAITAASNIWSKKIDVDQKQEDRNQELRKLYLTRKLEAGEKIIARRVRLASNIEYRIENYRRFISDSGFFERKFNEVIEESNALGKVDRGEASAYLLYYDVKQSDEVQAVVTSNNQISQKLNLLLIERNRLLKIDTEEAEERGFDVEEAYNKNEIKINETAITFFSNMNEFKALLIKSCDEIRESLSKYDFS